MDDTRRLLARDGDRYRRCRGTIASSPVSTTRPLWCATLERISSYGGSTRRRTHLGYFRAVTVIKNHHVMVSGFAWASAVSGARSGCPPAPGHGRVAAV
jgi:hypothetical protein